MSISQPNLPAEGSYTDLEQLFISEQPKNLWPVNQNSNFGAVRKTLTGKLQDALTTLAELSQERFVATSLAEGYLGRWEAEVGLPVAPTGRSEAERRALVLGRLRKGAFTRQLRREIVEAHIQVTFGAPVELTPGGVPITGDGIALFSEGGVVTDLYSITENVTDFSYAVRISDTLTPDMISLERELRRVTPGWIDFSVDLVPQWQLDPYSATKGIAAGGGIWFFGTTDVGLDMDLIDGDGATWVRLDMYWRDVETADGTFNWTQPDRMFDAADARGIRVLFLIHRTPSWARSGGTDLTYPTDAAKYGDFCADVVNRYKARGTFGCHHYELWNEPNANWAAADVSNTGAAKLAAMIDDAAPKMRAADPTVYIVGPGIVRGGTAGSGTYRLDTEYVSALYSQGLNLDSLDAMAFHPYTYGGTSFDPNDTSNSDVNHGFNRIDDMRSAILAAGDDIPIWITEWGQHTGSATGFASEANQAVYLQNAWDRYKALLDLGICSGPFFVYQHRDGGTNLAVKEENFGLTKNDRTTHKPARATYLGLS